MILKSTDNLPVIFSDHSLVRCRERGINESTVRALLNIKLRNMHLVENEERKLVLDKIEILDILWDYEFDTQQIWQLERLNIPIIKMKDHILIKTAYNDTPSKHRSSIVNLPCKEVFYPSKFPIKTYIN